MDALDDALRARIDELAGSNKGRQPILSTTGTQVAIAELIARNDRLERLVGEFEPRDRGPRRLATRRHPTDVAAASDR